MEQAEKTIDFIEEIKNGNITYIRICCKAGFSRSRAIAEFIYRYCKENNIEVDYEDRDGYTTVLNHGVLRRLNHAYWKKHKIHGYEDENENYPEDLIKIPIRYVREREKHRNRKHEKV